jgi:hypothetical protein
MSNENWKIFVIAGGFYYFGEEVDAPQEGFIAMKKCSMSGGFSGGKGIAGVTRGDRDAKIILDRFDENELCIWPLSCCYGILPCIDLYSFKGTTLR